MFDRTDQIRGAEGVVDDQWQTVFMGNLCYRIDVRNVAVGIAQSFQINGPGVFLNGIFYLVQVMGVNKGCFNAVGRQRVFQQVEAAAVDGFLGNNVTAVGCQRLHSISHRRRAGGQSQRRTAAFQSCQPFFQHILGGIGQTSVNVAGVFQTEAVRRVLTVVEYIGSGLVNRHRP